MKSDLSWLFNEIKLITKYQITRFKIIENKHQVSLAA